jgi:extracellular elastinolytic metalloproteinase
MRAALLISLFGAAAFANAVDIEKFRLKSSTKYVKASDAVKAARLVKRGSEYIDTATELVKSVAPDAEFRVITDHYVGTNGIGHVNFRQTANGIDIDNAIFNVNVSFWNQRPTLNIMLIESDR